MKRSNWNFLPRKTRNHTKVKMGGPEYNSGRAQRAGGRSSPVRSSIGFPTSHGTAGRAGPWHTETLLEYGKHTFVSTVRVPPLSLM